MAGYPEYPMEDGYGVYNGVRGDRGGRGRCQTGADSKSGGPFGRLEYSTSNTLKESNISHRGTKDA